MLFGCLTGRATPIGFRPSVHAEPATASRWEWYCPGRFVVAVEVVVAADAVGKARCQRSCRTGGPGARSRIGSERRGSYGGPFEGWQDLGMGKSLRW